ncbi:MAG: winged helix-turn-helix domain-containing protein [Pelagimonas sp.]|uniref:winged helix-turn-helix domain-containing protein n=1 Tax=Pelagimonas sp. TaxID=2073170 RepID=UPI003D6B9FE5
MKQILTFGAVVGLCSGGVALAAPIDEMVQKLPKTVQEMRFHIAETPELIGVIRWDGTGQVVYPPQGSVPHHSDSIVLNNATELHSISQSAGAGKTVASALSPDRLYHCRSEPALCLVLDAESMGAPASVDDPYFAYFEKVMVWFYVVIAVLLVVVIGFFWALRRRPAIPTDPESFAIGPVQINPRRSSCIVDGVEEQLSARDIVILRVFADHPGEVVRKDALYDAGWGRDYMPNSRALDQHMLALRRKLGDAELIETVHGQGYRLPN